MSAGKGTSTDSDASELHAALFGDDKDDDQAKNGSQSGSQADDDDDDDLDEDEDGDAGSGTEDQDDDKPDQAKVLSERLKAADRRANRAEAELRKLKAAARGADSGGSDDKSGDKDDKGTGDDGDVDARIAAAKLEAKIEYSEDLVASRLEAALEALNVQDASDIVSDLNLGKYVTENGSVDKAKLTAKIEQFKTTYRRRRGVGHGNSGGDKDSGVTNADRFADALGL